MNLPSLLTLVSLSPLFPTTTSEKAVLVVWGQRGARPKATRIPSNPHGQWRNPSVWGGGWMVASQWKDKMQILDPLGKKREMHMETGSQESRSMQGLTAVGETLTPELRFLWSETSFPKSPDFLPYTFILPQRRNQWLVGKLESTKHVLLSSFLYDICVLTRNTRLSNPTLSVHQYLTDYNAKLQVKNMFKTHGFKQHLQLLDSDWPISQVKVDLLEILL